MGMMPKKRWSKVSHVPRIFRSALSNRGQQRALVEPKSKPKRIIQIRFISPDGSTEDGPRVVLDE